MTYDFDTDSQNDYDEEEIKDTGIEEKGSLPSIAPPIQKDDDDEKLVKSKVPATKQKNSKIEIDIKSVNDLTSSLEFSTQQFNEAISRIEKNNDLMHILEVLNKIKTNQFENFKNISKNIDTTQIEELLKEKIEVSSKKMDAEINKSTNNIKSSTQKTIKAFKEYSEAFSDVDVIESLESIKNIENFMKKIKFKSIIFSSIFAAIISAIATAGGVSYYFKVQEKIQLDNKLGKVNEAAKVLKDKNIKIYRGSKKNQLVFSKNENVSYFETKDGQKVLEFAK